MPAGISTQNLSREEDATAAGSSRCRCERLRGALSGVDACRSALLRQLHAKSTHAFGLSAFSLRFRCVGEVFGKTSSGK